jgi:hypothetical protein
MGIITGLSTADTPRGTVHTRPRLLTNKVAIHDYRAITRTCKNIEQINSPFYDY